MPRDPSPTLDPPALRRALLDHLRRTLDAFDVETAAFAGAERTARSSALEDARHQAEACLALGLAHAPAEAFVGAALATLGLGLQTLGEREARFARAEGVRAWCDLLLLEAESARDVTRIFPLRAEVLSRRQAVLRPQDDAASGGAALSLATLRQMQGFSAEDGNLRLSEGYRRFLAAGRAEGKWKRPDNTARRDYGPIFRGFVAAAGDCRLAELTVSHTRRYAEAVKASAATTAATKAKYLDRVAAVLCWARDQGMVHDVTGPLRMTPTYPSYAAFTAEELRRLCESADYRDVTFAKGAAFWAPLLALYTGARVNEIASIRLEDVSEEGGTLLVLLSPAGRRTGKNDHSRRWVPVHAALIDSGFLDYLAALAREGQAVLFPEIGCAARDGKGKRITDELQAYRRRVRLRRGARARGQDVPLVPRDAHHRAAAHGCKRGGAARNRWPRACRCTRAHVLPGRAALVGEGGGTGDGAVRVRASALARYRRAAPQTGIAPWRMSAGGLTLSARRDW